jgi:hypothetical protein
MIYVYVVGAVCAYTILGCITAYMANAFLQEDDSTSAFVGVLWPGMLALAIGYALIVLPIQRCYRVTSAAIDSMRDRWNRPKVPTAIVLPRSRDSRD